MSGKSRSSGIPKIDADVAKILKMPMRDTKIITQLEEDFPGKTITSNRLEVFVVGVGWSSLSTVLGLVAAGAKVVAYEKNMENIARGEARSLKLDPYFNFFGACHHALLMPEFSPEQLERLPHVITKIAGDSCYRALMTKRNNILSMGKEQYKNLADSDKISQVEVVEVRKRIIQLLEAAEVLKIINQEVTVDIMIPWLEANKPVFLITGKETNLEIQGLTHLSETPGFVKDVGEGTESLIDTILARQRGLQNQGEVQGMPESQDNRLPSVAILGGEEADYTHTSYYEALELLFESPPAFPNIDNNLINGKGSYDCQLNCDEGVGLAKFNFTSGKKHRLRLINTGMTANQKFSIDGHELTVIANDFVPVQPYKTNVVTLGVGQRTDVIVEATGEPTGVYWMRSDIDMDCLNMTSTIPNATAIIYYEQANLSTIPSTTATSWTSNECRNDPLESTVPYYPKSPPSYPAITQELLIELRPNASGAFLMYVNNISTRVDYDNSILLQTNAGISSSRMDPELSVYNFGSNSSVRFVVYNTWGQQHPMHLHGHNFWVLAEGKGTWDGAVTNPSNPQRRDTHLMMPGSTDTPSYIVLEWEQNNPGVWPMHCHMSSHVSGGLIINILEQPSSIRSQNIPQTISQTCADWAYFASHDYVDQIDSGV